MKEQKQKEIESYIAKIIDIAHFCNINKKEIIDLLEYIWSDEL